jgi:hypothetical protein
MQVKVNDLLQRLSKVEHDVLNEQQINRQTYVDKLKSLNEKYESIKNRKEEIQKKLHELKYARNENWHEKKEDFELTLQYGIGNDQMFLEKSRILLSRINEKIQLLEKSYKNYPKEEKRRIYESLRNLKLYRTELMLKIERVRKERSYYQIELYNWLKNKANFIEKYLDTLQHKN